MDLRYYHATWSGNIPSILEKGIRSRSEGQCESLVDDILSEYGETRESIPKYYWKWPLLRCKETVNRVYLSGDRDYAVCNCLAGFEAETQLRSHLEARKRHAKFRFLSTKEALKKEMPCSVCEIALSRDEVPRELMAEFEHRAESASLRSPDKFPTKEAALDYILENTTITLPMVTSDKIKSCEAVGSEEEVKRCGI
jgi:hypothetical protein